jgi:hypothetical protein
MDPCGWNRYHNTRRRILVHHPARQYPVPIGQASLLVHISHTSQKDYFLFITEPLVLPQTVIYPFLYSIAIFPYHFETVYNY